MRVQVTTRDGSSYEMENVTRVIVHEPGQPTPPAVSGQLVLSAAAIIAWLPLPDKQPAQEVALNG